VITTERRISAALATLALTATLAGCSTDGTDQPSGSTSVGSSPSPSSEPVEALIETALGQLNAGDDVAARGTFENVLTLDPENVYAHYNLGLIAQERGQTPQAVASYNKALAADASFGPALYNKGILTEATALDAAVELYRMAIEADPTFAPAYMRLGFALVHLGQPDEGEKYLAKGIQLDPSMTEVAAPSYR
jgi:Tfp pilus assembly protein PilF